MSSILKVSEIQDPTNGNTALSIDSSGRVSMPNVPAFGARQLSNSQSSNGNDTANEILVFSSVLYNVGSGYNSSTGVFTCPLAGSYFFTFSGLYDSSYNNQGTAYIRLNGSGSSYSGEKYRGYHHNSGSNYEQISMSGVIVAAVNDTLDIFTGIAGWHIGAETSFSGFFIG